MCTPDAGCSGEHAYSRHILDRMTAGRVQLPDGLIYVPEDSDTAMQAPEWATFLSIVDGSLNPVPLCDLDQVLLKEVMAENLGLTFLISKNDLPHTNTRAHSTWPGSPGSPPRGRAAGGGEASDPRRPSQRRTATPPGTPHRHPHGAQRQPARAHTVGPVQGPNARTDRHPGHTGCGTPAARSRGQAARGGTAPDTRYPSQRWQATPPGDGPPPPPGTHPPQGMQAKGTVLGPQTHTPATTARGWRTPTTRPVGGQSGEGQRLTSDAPHNGGRHPPRGHLSATPTASNAGPQ